MPLAVGSHETERIDVPGSDTVISNYFGHMFVQDNQPQAYLVDIAAPNVDVATHFHRTDEFQIVLSEGCTIGGHHLEPVAVHYADSFKPYGLVGDQQGLVFYVVRAYAENGEFLMPESQSVLKGALVGSGTPRGRTASSGVREGEFSPGEGAASEEIFPAEADGLAAYSVRVSPGGTISAPDPGWGGGQFYVVVNGSWSFNGASLGPRSLVWVARSEPSPLLQAGPEGLEAVLVQFSRHTPAVAPDAPCPFLYQEALSR